MVNERNRIEKNECEEASGSDLAILKLLIFERREVFERVIDTEYVVLVLEILNGRQQECRNLTWNLKI